MKLVASRNYYKWKENIEEILNIESQPFIKVKSITCQEIKYYMYGGIVNNKLRLYFYSSKIPNTQINYILIEPQDFYNDKVIIFNNEREELKPFLPSDLLDITYTKKFEVGKPYKIISEDNEKIFYGFYVRQESKHYYAFDCYSSFVKENCRELVFEDLAYTFYSLDD